MEKKFIVNSKYCTTGYIDSAGRFTTSRSAAQYGKGNHLKNRAVRVHAPDIAGVYTNYEWGREIEDVAAEYLDIETTHCYECIISVEI